MGIVKRIFRTKKSRSASKLMEPTSLVAFAQLSGTEQSRLAQSLLAETMERRSQQRAS
jgi:hypothetical protein